MTSDFTRVIENMAKFCYLKSATVSASITAFFLFLYRQFVRTAACPRLCCVFIGQILFSSVSVFMLDRHRERETVREVRQSSSETYV